MNSRWYMVKWSPGTKAESRELVEVYFSSAKKWHWTCGDDRSGPFGTPELAWAAYIAAFSPNAHADVTAL